MTFCHMEVQLYWTGLLLLTLVISTFLAIIKKHLQYSWTRYLSLSVMFKSYIHNNMFKNIKTIFLKIAFPMVVQHSARGHPFHLHLYNIYDYSKSFALLTVTQCYLISTVFMRLKFLPKFLTYFYFFCILSVLGFGEKSYSIQGRDQGDHSFLVWFPLFNLHQFCLIHCPSSPTHILFSREEWKKGEKKKKRKGKFLERRKIKKMTPLRGNWMKEYQRQILMGESSNHTILP